MNERIRELALQSGAIPLVGHDGLIISNLDAEKFAELIVKECIAECWYDATPKQISDNIKMKFGVE